MSDRLRATILGGSGYAGGELIRFLLAHPRVEIGRATSRRYAGKAVGEAHPSLRGIPLDFEAADHGPAILDGTDVLFCALPHGESAKLLPSLFEGRPDLPVVDLGGDFRLRDASLYPEHYGWEHPAPDLLPTFVYGLTESAREAIRGAKRVANPGCFATGIALGLLPAARAGLLPDWVPVDAITGSTGSGNAPKSATHHPERAENLRAYRPLVHQHLPEITQVLEAAGTRTTLSMVPHSAPMTRGIHATIHIRLGSESDGVKLAEACRAFAEGEPFVRYLESPPEVRAIARSNFCDLSCAVVGDRGVVFTAIDNLVKGAAGQAVQNLNVMMGWPETEGLFLYGGCP